MRSLMGTHEMILLPSLLQGVGTCIPLCLVVGFPTFAALENWVIEACRTMPQHSKFLGTLVPGDQPMRVACKPQPPEDRNGGVDRGLPRA